jgi:hypothetical protein
MSHMQFVHRSPYLSSSQDNVIFDGSDGGAVEWRVCYEALEHVQRVCIHQLRGLVFRRRNEVRSVWTPLDVGDLSL